MHLVIQKYPRCFWHIDCPRNEHNSGVVKDYPAQGDVTPVECMHCGEKGTVMRGTHFDTPFLAEPPTEREGVMFGATHYADLSCGRVYLDLSGRNGYRINYGDGWESHSGWPPIQTNKVNPIVEREDGHE